MTNSTTDKASEENVSECMKNKTNASMADFPNKHRLGLLGNILIRITFEIVPKIAKGKGQNDICDHGVQVSKVMRPVEKNNQFLKHSIRIASNLDSVSLILESTQRKALSSF